MFTTQQIKAAQGKVKSGADFPDYVRELKQLGVTHYETFVADGHTDYYGADNYKTSSDVSHYPLLIAEIVDEEQFRSDLKAHQNGKTGYLTFCNDAAKSGVEKWIVEIGEMTCTYFDTSGNKILTEQIPV